MASKNEGKSSWEELVGVQGEIAVTTIEKENPSVKAEIVLEGTSVSEDLRFDRVRVWVDKCGIVTKIPVIG